MLVSLVDHSFEATVIQTCGFVCKCEQMWENALL